MSDADRPDIALAAAPAPPGATTPPADAGESPSSTRPRFPEPPVGGHATPAEDWARKRRTRLKRLRFVGILLAVLVLGLVSFVFGMFVAVASDLPSLTRFSLYKDEKSSVLYDDLGHPIGVLSQQNRVIVTPEQIPAVVKDAVISIEDKRFRSNSGVDLRGIARAFLDDIERKGAAQGASTIEEQFIKNALQAQSHRTIFEKLREAALAYQLSHKWSKEKIITAYLNTIYFGNGAYGIEAAAQTYFGHEPDHQGCGTPGQKLCVEELRPWEAAMLAGIIQSPTEYDPVEHPLAARERRDVVLAQMREQGYISRAVYAEGVARPVPSSAAIQAPQEQNVEGVDAGYFTSWVQQQVIERYGQRAFYGGLKITTTLNLELQRAAEQAVDNYLSYPEGPTASLVAIENSTGEVRAMVGGRDYDESPFNLATEGERQPGSSFKAFDLAAALEDGISPESEWTSKEKEFIVPNSGGKERFVVHNDEGAYVGERTLTNALAYSDNSVFAEVGLKVGTTRIADLAHAMGITTPLSTNPAMTIGGLTTGVTPLDMAHAYETIAHDGQRVSGTLAEAGSPVGIQEVIAPDQPLANGSHRERNRVTARRVLSPEVAATETQMLETVLQYGTGKAAAIGQFAAGKTGTTSNYVDAWFVGWDSKFTVAVWVGYPNKFIPMTSDFDDGPVLGGTYPALIWHDFQVAALQIEQERAERAAGGHASGSGKGATAAGLAEGAAQSSAAGAQGAAPAGAGKGAAKTSAPAAGAGEAPAAKTGGGAGERAGTPASPAPAVEAPSAPAAAPGSTPAEPSAGGEATSPPPASSATGGVSPGG
ncbi:MAG TPA: transglycosylase domain-containing protein [Solirubrobacteraceae bacterium]|jgi:penicillin-binding protein 1A|nr:transglycosylase domain-containing protein [Solirubrobacteraceae bacterium]